MFTQISTKIQTKYQNCFLLILFAFFLCIRELDVFKYGRFWTEEGATFFYVAWVLPPLQALFYAFGGYLNLATNAATLLARFIVPLEYAPYVTSLIGLIFQLTPLLLLLTARDEWLISFKNRLFATLLFLFVPDNLETSLQSLHIQFYLILSISIILVINTNQTKFLRLLKLFLLFLSALSGLMTFILLPLYAIKSFLEKNWLRKEQFVILLIGCLIQYFIFYAKETTRSYHFFISDYLSILFTRDLLIPFAGYNHVTTQYMNYINKLTQNGHHILLIPCIISSIFIMTIILCFYKYPQIKNSIFLFISALFLLGISIFGALGDLWWFYIPHVNQRYIFISQALFSLMLLYFSYYLPKKGQIICNIVILWLIIVGCFNFFSLTINKPNNVLPWKEQVSLWRKNPSYVFQCWGGDIWKLKLQPHQSH